jgi:hypothetical protein
LFAAVLVVAVGASVEGVCGEAVAEGSGAGALALCPSPVLVDCWPSAVEPPLPVEPSEGAVDGDGEPLSPAVVPEPVPVWLAWALWPTSGGWLVEPVGSGELVWADASVGSDEPAWVDEPVASREPVGSDEPACVDEPVASDEPAWVDEPVGSDESVASEEPAASDEPVASEEPAGSDEPVCSGALVGSDGLVCVVAAV